MKGMPKYLNTKEDFEVCRNMFAPEKWKPKYQELLDDRYVWNITGTLGPEDEGVTDATHQVGTDIQAGEEVRVQMELVEDPNARIFRLGFTVAEVEAFLAE